MALIWFADSPSPVSMAMHQSHPFERWSDRYRVRHIVRQLPLAVGACIAAACSDNGVQPQWVFVGEQASVQSCDLSPSMCDRLEEAIDFLRNHSDSQCRGLGDQARDRFNSSTDGYKPGSLPHPAWVEMLEQPDGSWEPANGNVFINESHVHRTVGQRVGRARRATSQRMGPQP